MKSNSYSTFGLYFTGATDSVYSTRLTTAMTRSITLITRAGDTIVGLFNTTAGKSTGGKDGRFAKSNELPAQAIDDSVGTKYLNYGGIGGHSIINNAPGVDTGYYVTPAISNASVAVGVCFATANDAPNRDPITITLEGTNSDALDDGSSWSFIYNGSTGISPTDDPGRMTFVAQQNFSNSIAYKSYRLLVTSQRGPDSCVQYSEAQIIGYVESN